MRDDSHSCISGAFTTNMVAAAPVLYCKEMLDISKTVSSLCLTFWILYYVLIFVFVC